MWPFSPSAKKRAELEERAGNWLAFEDLKRMPLYSGVTVDETTAVNLPAVYKCVSLNSETIASLPIDTFAKRGEVRVPYTEPAWLREPNPLQTQAEFIAMSQASLDLDGNCFWMKTIDALGRLAGLSILAPTAVEVRVEELNGRAEVIYMVNLRSGREALSSREVLHLRALTLPGELRGLSPIKCAQQTIGIGLAAEQFGAQFFGSGATLSGVIETPSNLTKEQADRLKESFTKKHGGISKSHAIGILSGGAAWKPLSVNPEEAQFLASRSYTATEIANLFGCPPEFVAGSGMEGAKGYVSGLHMRLRMWYLTGLLPRITRLEDALSSLLPRPAYVKFNTNALLRMDPAERTNFYAAAQLGQWMTRNEIRALEEMDPMEDGDEVLESVQWVSESEPSDEEPEPAPVINVDARTTLNPPQITVDATTTIQRGAMHVTPAAVNVKGHDYRQFAAPDRVKREKRILYDAGGHIVGIEETEHPVSDEKEETA